MWNNGNFPKTPGKKKKNRGNILENNSASSRAELISPRTLYVFRVYLRETHGTPGDKCKNAHVSIAYNGRNWKQPKSPIAAEWINKSVVVS